MFGEVFSAFHGFVSEASCERQYEVAKGGKDLGCRAGADAAGVLAQGDVADQVKPVFDAPVRAGQAQELFRPHPRTRQTGDGVDNLDAFLVPKPAPALDPADLGQTRPIEMRHHLDRGLQCPPFDAAMALVGFARLRQVRRQLAPCEGGECRRKPARCQPRAAADYP